MKAARALIELLRTEGVEHVFGNPGTTELPFMDALVRTPDIRYLLGLHESVAVSMADGYARATRRPSFVSLHVAAGLANGLSMVLNAKRARTPIVVTAGQQDRRFMIEDPMLSGDLVALAQGAFKEQVEITRTQDLPVLLRRAFLHAQAPPQGPVFVSIPVDVLEEELPDALPARSHLEPLGSARNVDELADHLLAAARPAIVAGDGVGREDAVAELVRVAEALGATVYHEPMYDAVGFPATHDLSAGMLPPVNAEIRKRLQRHDVVLLAGSHAFSAHYYTPTTAIPEDVTVLQLDSDALELGRTYSVRLGLHGGLKPTLDELARSLQGRCADAERRRAEAAATAERIREARAGDADPGDPAAAAEAFTRALPGDTILVEEAITTGLHVRRTFAAERPGSYHHSVGGALGWGIGGALGIKLARPANTVVAAVGDGTAMYTIQSLWTAARYEIPILAVVFNNREYRACKQGVERTVTGERAGGFVGMDLAPPVIDFTGLAAALGVRAARAHGAAEIEEQVHEALASGEPRLLEIAIGGIERPHHETASVPLEAAG